MAEDKPEGIRQFGRAADLCGSEKCRAVRHGQNRRLRWQGDDYGRCVIRVARPETALGGDFKQKLERPQIKACALPGKRLEACARPVFPIQKMIDKAERRVNQHQKPTERFVPCKKTPPKETEKTA